ncbi:MAG: hypothetical protein LUG16_02840 [Candidatus Gastranaerophilales bacterium]|nr:hypothetical protein [Candidatus Gastranaerophilales bacterium]
MISLDLDLSYLSKYYNIGRTALENYQGMSIVQIMETEAEKGNNDAARFLMQITNNPEELANLFQLVNPENRYLILSNMNQDDLINVMACLDPEEMILGLSIFTPEALVELMMLLEPESLATVVLNTMDPYQFLQAIPEEFMDEFIDSDDIDREIWMQALGEVDEEHLQKMMENITGQACYDDRDTILATMSSYSDDDFMASLHGMETEGKQDLILNVLAKKPELFESFSQEAMTYPFQTMQKEDILKSLMVLDTEEMIPMVEDLPQEIMALIATQIDPAVFAKLLCKDFTSVIANCGIDLS